MGFQAQSRLGVPVIASIELLTRFINPCDIGTGRQYISVFG